ncbi:nucleoside diphosphate kinase regulator [Stutzerimonas tarimensis]|uniref:Nucleoside diphosphate kinase regulator n=1 Tax=Stutzerimonas tarimensis TaxID=1507735 RepID=A0ABV7T6Q1_9GAMM
MSSTPPITLTANDVQRLERLLDDMSSYGPAAEALEQEMARAQVVERSALPPGVVSLNSRVHCREETTGKDYHLTLVMPQDARQEGTVSVLAPVGTALLGLSVGQHIDWPTPGGKLLRLTLLEVEYQPEADGAQ